MSDYLWDKTGEPEEDVEQLENLLGTLKYQPRPLDIPASAMPKAKVRPTWMIFSRPQLAIAASLLLMLLAGAWFVTRQTGQQQPNQVVTTNKGSETAADGEYGAVAIIAHEVGHHLSGDNAIKPKPREGKAPIITVSSYEAQRVLSRFIAKRQKLQPRRSVEDTPAPREEIAINGERWDVGQPLTPQQREATEKLMLALQLASAKFNYAQREMREMGRAGK